VLFSKKKSAGERRQGNEVQGVDLERVFDPFPGGVVLNREYIRTKDKFPSCRFPGHFGTYHGLYARLSSRGLLPVLNLFPHHKPPKPHSREQTHRSGTEGVAVLDRYGLTGRCGGKNCVEDLPFPRTGVWDPRWRGLKKEGP